MTPKFALSLSVDGIVLLHRVSGGWNMAGDVSLTSTDLDGDMAALRDRAAALADGDLTCKLILPNDQIRYLTIETARTSLEDIKSAVQAATPLSLDEITIDFDRNGGRTHIAAVARQTLKEAETFARDHGFVPVACVAVAAPYTFSSEVFFGPTAHARDTLGIGGEVSRDDHPPVATAVSPLLVSQPAPPSDTPADIAVATATAEADPDNQPDQLPVFVSRSRSTTDRAASPVDTPIARFTRSTQDVDLKPFVAKPVVAEPAAATAAVTPPNPAPHKDPAGVMAQYRTTTAKRPTSQPVIAADAVLAKGVAASYVARGTPRYLGLALTIALLAALALAGLWANRHVDGGVAGLLEVDPGLQPQAEPVAVVAEPPATPAPTAEPAPETVIAAETPPATPLAEETPPAPIVTAVPGRVLSPDDAARIYAATGVWQRAPRLPGEPDEADQSTLAGLHSFATVSPVDDIARPDAPVAAALMHELPILTPLNPTPPGVIPLRDADGFIRATATGTLLPTGLTIYGRAPAARPPLRPTDDEASLIDTTAPLVPADVPAELRYVAYIPDSDLPEPRAFRAPSLSQPLAIIQPDLNAPDNLSSAKFLTAPPPAAPAAEPGPAITDTLAAQPQDPTAPADDTVAVGTAPDAAPAQTGPAQSVAAIADAPLATPPAAAPDASAGFVDVIQGSPAVVPPLRPGTPEIAPEATADAATPDATTDSATPDVTADATAPDATTDAATPDATADAATPDRPLFQDPALAGLRPTPRPTGLAPASTATFEAIPELAGARPSLRPDGLAPVPDTDAEVAAAVAAAIAEETPVPASTDVSAIVASIAAAAPPSQIVNPTRSAIVVSPRPDQRPQNFARVVANVQTLQQRQETRDTAAATSAAVVQQAAPQAAPATAPATGGQTAVTVARAATIDNAIRLRDMNLIGVYGKPGARRALVRMPNGRFVKVEVGSTLDGGRVTAIGDTALNFVKRGQTYALQLPAG